MSGDILVPLGLFAMIAAIVIGPTWLKHREKKEMQETLRRAIDKGQSLPTELIESLTQSAPKPATASRDIRVGVLLVATALGVAGFGAMIGYLTTDRAYTLVAFGAIPGAVGLAFVILSFFNKNKG